jgi:hypothetical protein
MTNGSKMSTELDDVFHDSILVLYEKLLVGISEINSILTNLFEFSIIDFQLLNKIGKDKMHTDYHDNSVDEG